jgi:hypothetical protein
MEHVVLRGKIFTELPQKYYHIRALKLILSSLTADMAKTFAFGSGMCASELCLD